MGISAFKYPDSTAGERLYFFVRTWLRKGNNLSDSFFWLDPISGSDDWSEYIEQLVSVAVAGRIVTAGRSLRSKYGTSTVFDTEFRSHIANYLLTDRDNLQSLFRLGITAAHESQRDIPKRLRARFRQWAQQKHPRCYLCGCPLDFNDDNSACAYTADHLWPQSFGGDSSEENLLPACRICNDQHKSNFATWAMTSVQSLILGIDPVRAELARVRGMHRYAIHHRQAQDIAIRYRKTLKSAYRQLGPSEALRTIDPSDVGHFFNLANHAPRNA